MSAERSKTAEEWFKDVAHQNARKNVWKMKSIEEKARADAAEKEARTWRRATVAIAAVCLLLAVALTCSATGRHADVQPQFISVPRAPAYAPLAAEMPPHAWATGLVENGRVWCSAVTILQEDEYGFGLCCGHCYSGKIGGKFWYRRPDGKNVEATLLAHMPPNGEGTPDLGLFRVAAADVLAVAPVVAEMPVEGRIQYDVIGYPGGQGPAYHPLDAPGTYGRSIWTFRVADGQRIHHGNSGSPIFVNGMVCGILSGANTVPMGATADSLGAPELARRRQGCGVPEKEPEIIGTHAFVTNQPTLVAFLKANRRFFGNGSPFCDKNGNCHKPDDLGEVAPPPAIKEGPPPAAPGPWQPKPNLPMPPPPYDGHGKQPSDLNTSRKKSSEIDKLRHDEATQQKLDAMDGKLDALLKQGQAAPLPPPLTDLSGIRSKLDAMHKDLADLQQPGPLAFPDISTIHGKLDALKQGMQDLGTLKGKLDAVHQDITAGKIDPAKLADILAAVNQSHAKLDSLPVGMVKAFIDNAPLAGQALAASAGPDLKAAAAAGIAGLVPGAGGIAGILALLASLHVGGTFLGNRLANGRPQNKAPPPTNGGGQSSVVPQPAPAGVAANPIQQPAESAARWSPPAGNSFRTQSIVPVPVADPLGEAMQQSTAAILKRNPNIPLLAAQPAIEELAQTILGLRPSQPPVGSTSNLSA